MQVPLLAQLSVSGLVTPWIKESGGCAGTWNVGQALGQAQVNDTDAWLGMG